MTARASRTKRALFAGVLFLLVLGFLEMALALLALASPRVEQLLASPWTETRPAIPDRRLGHRPTPGYPGHDGNGFRNPEVPARARIVALGDSQTYGTGVGPGSPWPRLLESGIGAPVYSMAYGGYGPAHSLLLWEEALALSPQVVIEAFYSGNDLYDSFNLVYNDGALPELKSPDAQVRSSIREAEQSESIAMHVGRMYLMGKTPVVVEGEVSRAALREAFLFARFVRHSNIYGLLRRARYELVHRKPEPEPAPGAGGHRGPRDTPEARWEQAKAFAQACPAYCQVFDDGRFRTLFTSEYRLAALNLEDARIAEGLRISLAAIRRMHERAAVGGVRFLVVLIPTKETVFRDLWQNPASSYRSLMENEERMWRTTKAFLERHGIEHLDALPALRERLAAGIQPYQVSIDGHPNEQGHGAIARLVAAHLASPGARGRGP
jgi:hypothetical protein